MTPTFIILAIIGLVVLWLIFAYNSFVTIINRVEEAWADIDVQFKRRYDLIPNLINTVKGYAKHESGVFENVSNARAAAMGVTSEGGTNSLPQKGQAENMLTDALKSIFAIAEAYPDLKANQNFLELQKELSDTENKIQAARRFYNSNVVKLNTSVESFPSNIIASIFKFSKKEFFELQEGDAREPVSVKF